jgi:hypothetical protein
MPPARARFAPTEPTGISIPRQVLLLLFVLLASTVVWAVGDSNGDTDLTRFGHDIHVPAGQGAQDVTCFFCSIYVRGNVAGDITALGGKIVFEAPVQIAGDVTTILGDITVAPGTAIAGDLTAVGGAIQRPSDAQIAGDVTPIRKGWWLTLLLVSPFILLGILIAAIVWLIQYMRRPRGVPAAV